MVLEEEGEGEGEEEGGRRRRTKPPPLLVASNFHAGPGQLTFGSDRRQTADLTLIREPGRIEVHNFHGFYYHYTGHAANCPLRRRLGQEDDEDEEEEEDRGLLRMNDKTTSGDAFKRGLVEALNGVGLGLRFSYRAHLECDLFHGNGVEDEDDDNGGVRRRRRQRGRRRRNVLTYEKLTERHGDDVLAPFEKKSFSQDELVRAVVEEGLQGFVTLRGGTTEPADGDADDDKVSRLFGFCQQLSTPRMEDIPEFTIGQVLQRYGVGREGSTEAEGLEALSRAEKHLENVCRTPLNLTRLSFDSEGPGHTLWTDQFRWLVNKRGLRGFRVVHFVHYHARTWLRPFLEQNLQARWNIRNDPSKKLDSHIYKLLNNGFYGYNSIQATTFPKVSVNTGETLCKRAVRRNYRGRVIEEEPIESLLFLGCRSRRGPRRDLDGEDDDDNEAGGMPGAEGDRSSRRRRRRRRQQGGRRAPERRPKSELLFLVTRKNLNAKLLNLHHVSGAILGLSKVIFYDHILHFLRTLDPSKAELAYLDTDSIILALSEDELDQCVERDLREEYEERRGSTFVDESSQLHQTGKLKVEMVASSGELVSERSFLSSFFFQKTSRRCRFVSLHQNLSPHAPDRGRRGRAGRRRRRSEESQGGQSHDSASHAAGHV